MKNNQPYLFLETQDLYLRPFILDDEKVIANTCNDPDFRMKIGQSRPDTPNRFQSIVQEEQKNTILFAIVKKSDNSVIGETGLLRMYPDWACSDLSIMIYEKTNQHLGYGQQAIKCLLNYAFGDLHLHRIAIGVVGFNYDALRFYEKVGFKKEGIQEEGYYYHYQYHDFIMMRILKQEFIALQSNS